jgi:hypothetical protein
MSAPAATEAAHGGFALVDPDSGRTLKVLPFRYDPDRLAHQIAPGPSRGEAGYRLEAPSPTGPSAETITLEAEFEPVDRLDWPNDVPLPARYGLHPVLAALETTMQPTSDHLLLQRDKARGGVLEIAPAESPLVVLVLGQSRVQPVQIVDYRVEEGEYDASLNPGRAKVSLTLRVLTNDDLGFDHGGGLVYRNHQRIRRTNRPG